MKTKLINFSISLIFVLIIGSIFTLLFTSLCAFNVIDKHANDNIMLTLSLFLFFSLGFIYGYKEKSRGLLNGLLLVIIYLVLSFTFKKLDSKETFSSPYMIVARCSLIVFGSILGASLSAKLNP